MEKTSKKITIAITGGIGSGKSQVAKIIKALGFSVFSCDEIYKEVISSQNYVEEIKKVFPDCIFNNQIDRKSLAKIVFNNEKQRKTLNNIAHPMIMRKLFNRMDNEETKLIFAEVPLLFEGEYDKLFDFVIIVQRDIKKRIESVKKRDGLSDVEILSRIESQFDYSKISDIEYFKNEKFIFIDNNGSIEELTTKVDFVINHLKY